MYIIDYLFVFCKGRIQSPPPQRQDTKRFDRKWERTPPQERDSTPAVSRGGVHRDQPGYTTRGISPVEKKRIPVALWRGMLGVEDALRCRAIVRR